MAQANYNLKIKKIERKQVWAEGIDGEEMWSTEMTNAEGTKVTIKTEERIDGFNEKDKVEIVLKNTQKTLK
jgi:hypothetical protein